VELGSDEKVHPGQAGAVKGHERTAGVVLNLPSDAFGQVRRDVELARVVEVLRLEVVELVIAYHPDLREGRRLRHPAGLALEDATLDLPPDDGGLNQDLRVVLTGRRHCGVQRRPVADLGDAVRGTGP